LLEEAAAEEDDEADDDAVVSEAGPSVCDDVSSVRCVSESSCIGLSSCGSAAGDATAAGPAGDDADEDMKRKDWKRRKKRMVAVAHTRSDGSRAQHE